MNGVALVLLVVLGASGLRSAAGRRASVRHRLAPPVRPVRPVQRVQPGRQVRWVWGRWRERGSRASADIEHARLLEVVARALRSGASLTGALAEAAAELPSSAAVDDLRRSLVAVRAGAPVIDALEQWRTASDARPRVLAGTALVLGAELGGVPARSLDAAASGLRDRAALAREVRALSSQARASAAVMVLGPPLFLGAAAAADPRLHRVLFGSPVGLTCMVVGAALDAAGAWWMAALVRGTT